MENIDINELIAIDTYVINVSVINNGMCIFKFIAIYTYVLNVRYECYNVGCMLPHIDYTPRTLDEIINSEKRGRINVINS